MKVEDLSNLPAHIRLPTAQKLKPSVTEHGADNEMKMTPLFVIFVLTLIVGGISAERVVVVYGANSHANQSVDQYSVQCSSTSLNIDIHNGQWNPIWNDATIIDLVNVGGAYKAAGKTGNAFLGLECDSMWLYGFVAYMPPTNDMGHQSFHPSELVLGFDTTDGKPPIPWKVDHLFAYVAGNKNKPLVHVTGTGVNNLYGGWNVTTSIPFYHNTSVIDFYDSVTKTPFFNLPPPLDKNPLYQFEVSRENLLKWGRFGLYVELRDDIFVSIANDLPYAATNVPGVQDVNGPVESQLFLWPDITLLQPTTQTTTISTTQSVYSSSPTTSPRTGVAATNSSVSVGLATQLVKNSLLIVASIAVGVALSVLAVFYAQKKKFNR